MALAAGDLCMARMAEIVHLNEKRTAVACGAELLVFMAAHAILVRHALGVEYLPDLVRLMAINAGGQPVGFLFPQFAFDHLAVDNLDLRMAFRACCSDVPASDG